MRKLVVIFCLMGGFFSCSKHGGKEHRFPVETKDIIVSEHKSTSFLYDTLTLESDRISYEGEIKMWKDNFYFIDRVFAQICKYSLDGDLIDCYIGLGEGPNEVIGIDEVTFADDFLVVMYDWNVYIFDYNFEMTSYFSLNFEEENKRSTSDLLNNPDLSDKTMYEVQYTNNKISIDKKGRLITKITTEHPKENAYISRNYYNDSRILAAINLTNGQIEEIFGRFSDAYSNYSYIPNHAYAYYSLYDDLIYLAYEPDHLIYVFDSEMNPLFKFGYHVDDIDLAFRQTDILSAYEDVESFDFSRNSEGYYMDVEVFSEHIFRKYHREDGTYGLLAFEENRLIANLTIPERYTLIGENELAYYIDGIVEEDGEELKVLILQKSSLNE